LFTLYVGSPGIEKPTAYQEAHVRYGTLKLSTAVATVAFALGTQQLAAQAAPIGTVLGDVSQEKGVVTAVDAPARSLVVRASDGEMRQLTVPLAIPNLDQVKVGDTVVVSYVESIGLYLHAPGSAPVAATSRGVTVKPTGLPAVTGVVVKEAVAVVTAVNWSRRSLTVVGPEGNSFTFQVDPSVKEFNNVKVGDHILVRYTQALAVSIKK
jgi:hypothetical protein